MGEFKRGPLEQEPETLFFRDWRNYPRSGRFIGFPKCTGQRLGHSESVYLSILKGPSPRGDEMAGEMYEILKLDQRKCLLVLRIDDNTFQSLGGRAILMMRDLGIAVHFTDEIPD